MNPLYAESLSSNLELPAPLLFKQGDRENDVWDNASPASCHLPIV